MSRHHSTFYTDGFLDGRAGRPFSAPDVAVYAAEYRAGYDAGRNSELFEAADLVGTSDDTAAVQAQALTAEFNSPLNRDNRRRKLKRSTGGASLWQDPEQVDLFGGGQ